MITNILASIVISLVTNTTENVLEYERYEYPSRYTLEMHIDPSKCDYKKGVNPTKKQITTTVVEITTVKFWLDGHEKPHETKVERVISESNKTLVREVEWKEIGPKYISLERLTNIVVGTNFLFDAIPVR